MTRFRAILEYDGTDFFGFQRQASGRTVQGELEAALTRMNSGQQVTVYGAGRTDSGVHATGQVVAFDLQWRHGDERLLRALNAHMPRDMAVRTVEPAPERFHPRFAARARRYEYRIFNAPVRSPRHERMAWHVWPELDVESMRCASQALVGRHDFATFGTAPDHSENTVRTVCRAEWQAEKPLLVFEIEADAFLFRMVRRIVGTLKQVGDGKLTPAGFAERRAAIDGSLAGPAAPPNGLCLVEVRF